MSVTVDSLEIEVQGSSDSASGSINTLVSALNELREVLEKSMPRIKDSGSAIRDMGKDYGRAASGAKSAAKSNSEFLSSIVRIAKYRLIRSALKSITDGFRTGIQDLVRYSAAMNSLDSARANATMSAYATTLLEVKNAIGAAAMPLLQLLVPTFQAVANVAIGAANAVNQILAALGGKSTFTKAKTYAVDYAKTLDKTTGSANKLKNAVLGFDELNIIDNTSGGGAAQDFSQMFEESNLDSWAKDFSSFLDGINKKFADFKSGLKISFNDVFLKWDNLTGEQIAKKVIAGLTGLTGAAVGFKIGGVPGAIVGTLLGVSLGLLLSTLIFDNDGKLSKDELIESAIAVILTIGGGIVGAVLGSGAGAAIGITIGAGLTLGMHELFFKNKGTTKDTIIKAAVVALGAIGGGIIGFAVGGAVGAAIGVSIGASLSLGLSSIVFNDKVTQEAKATAGVALTAIMTGFIGAVLGLSIGGVLGGIVGGTIGIILGAELSLNLINVKDGVGESAKRAAATTTGAIISGLVGALIGFSIGGAFGAIVGGIVGIGLGLAITWNSVSVDEPDIPKTNFQKTLDTVNNDLKYNQYSKVAMYASGGFPTTGQMFVARENGIPEMVGNIGGRAAVANNADIVASVADGVYSAVVSAMSGMGGDVNVYLDGKQISASVKRANRESGASIGTGGLVYA